MITQSLSHTSCSWQWCLSEQPYRRLLYKMLNLTCIMVVHSLSVPSCSWHWRIWTVTSLNRLWCFYDMLCSLTSTQMWNTFTVVRNVCYHVVMQHAVPCRDRAYAIARLHIRSAGTWSCISHDMRRLNRNYLGPRALTITIESFHPENTTHIRSLRARLTSSVHVGLN